MPEPVDLHTELGRISTAERLQQLTDRASLAAQQRTAAHMAEERLSQETEVQATSQSESDQVDAEAHRKNPFMGRRRHKTDQDESEQKSPGPNHAGSDPDEGQRLDVSV